MNKLNSSGIESAVKMKICKQARLAVAGLVPTEVVTIRTSEPYALSLI